ncbi:MAG: PIN domain-containing protein [Bacteroidetes bacterium]|nr:PIN domain-containing protein [Bacteroidota bacterium]
MKVLIDTCVWSRVLRRRDPDPAMTARVADLISDGRAVLIGPILQELLSGVREGKQFASLKKHLAPFEDVPLQRTHFEKAAEFCNMCRAQGVQGSTIDFLICAVAHIEGFLIMTTDGDFGRFARHLPISLHE